MRVKSYEFSNNEYSTIDSCKKLESPPFHGQIIDRFEKLSRVVFLKKKKKKKKNKLFEIMKRSERLWRHVSILYFSCGMTSILTRRYSSVIRIKRWEKIVANTICFILNNALLRYSIPFSWITSKCYLLNDKEIEN